MDDEELLAACCQKMQTQALRPGQGDVIRSLLKSCPCLAVMPTGGGKTLLWLLTTHIWNNQHREGVEMRPLTLVIVPYKALVISHVQDSTSWFPCLSSENSPQEMQRGIKDCSVIYTTPEKFIRNPAFQEIIVANASRIRLIAVDEAHLLREQARFRPDLQTCIECMRAKFPSAVRLAVTATSRLCDTANLVHAAGMPSHVTIVRCSIDRSNCFISIAPILDTKDKSRLTKFSSDHKSMFALMNAPSKPRSIIFVCSKSEAENLAQQLQNLCSESTHLKCEEICFFHADIDPLKKMDIMSRFADELRVVVATTAFGTGINFRDIRVIMHYCLPSSLSEYMQNIGRGGRDGLRYHCVLYFSYKTIHEQGTAWMTGVPIDEIPEKWARYVDMVKFVRSSNCRRSFILPFFDASHDAGSSCQSCDACSLSDDGVEPYFKG
jgi:ATP-dependent DNA helicase RecQ